MPEQLDFVTAKQSRSGSSGLGEAAELERGASHLRLRGKTTSGKQTRVAALCSASCKLPGLTIRCLQQQGEDALSLR